MSVAPRPLRRPGRHLALVGGVRPLAVGAVALALGAATALGAGPAAAASSFPTKPTGLHVSAAGSSWFTVSTNRSAHASSYTLYASTYKPDLYYAHLTHGQKSAARHSARSSHPSMTVAGLRYTTAPIYYRVVAGNGPGKAAYSAGIEVTGLRPSTPTALAGHSSSTGTYLTWNSGAATGFSIATATGPAMTTGYRTYAIHDTSHQFTPYGLSAGARYYARVRAWNGPTPSAWTAPTALVVQSRQQSIRVMTYNVLQLSFDGTRERGGVVAPWSQRRVAAASLIRSVDPDVIGVQEAGAYTSKAYDYLQIDSLRSALASAGAQYAKADTEPAIGSAAFKASGGLRTGNYILYKPSLYRAAGAGGYWPLGNHVYGVYQVLQNIRSGAKVLVVNTHLTQPGGRSNDLTRQAETRTMVSRAASTAASQHVPVVYLGDYNSNTNPKQYTLDGPGSVMRASHIADARLTAQARYNEHYDSANDYLRSPLHYDLDIDYVWTSPGVSASSWGVAMRLSQGKQVGVIASDHFPVWSSVQYGY